MSCPDSGVRHREDPNVVNEARRIVEEVTAVMPISYALDVHSKVGGSTAHAHTYEVRRRGSRKRTVPICFRTDSWRKATLTDRKMTVIHELLHVKGLDHGLKGAIYFGNHGADLLTLIIYDMVYGDLAGLLERARDVARALVRAKKAKP